MEAILPASAVGKPQSARAPSVPVSGLQGPSVALPLAFVLTGVVALLIGIAWLVLQPAILAQYHYNQYVIAAMHLFVLGWCGSIVMGAMYQLVPVALETKLYSEKLVRWQFACHVVGFAGMVWMFRVWDMKQVGHFGCVMAVGVGLFVYNLARTLARVPKWNVTATAVAAALFWFSLTITAGLAIAAGKCSGEATDSVAVAQGTGVLVRAMRALGGFMGRFDAISAMHAHAHLGGIGLFTMLIVGVSYKLVPMFALSEIQSHKRAAVSIVGLNLGLAGSFITILLRSPWKLLFAAVVVGALAVYAWELAAILRARKRRALDWGIKSFLTAVALLLPLSISAAVLSWPGLSLNAVTGQLENLYGVLALLGVVSLAIIGMLYKIVPFLVWYGRYRQHIGRAKVPALADLYSARLQAVGYWSYLAGLGTTCAAAIGGSEIGVRCGGGLLALSVGTLAINIGMMLSHYFRPALQPLAVQSSVIPHST